MSIAVLALTLSAALGAADKPDDAAKAEMKKMEGTWKFDSITANGQDQSGDIKDMRLEVKGDARVVKKGDATTTTSTYKIDPKASPKTIDISISDGPENLKGRTLYGIYELDGDTFKVCLSLEGKDRPKKVADGEGVVLQVFKRVTEEKKK